MRKTLFYFLLIFTIMFVSCKEDKIVEPALFTISSIIENENGEKISKDGNLFISCGSEGITK